MKSKLILVLDNIRSVYNVGSIFRTADARGVSKIYLVGITPAPKDRFGRKRNDLAKVALGAEESVIWEKVSTLEACIQSLKEEGINVYAVEQSENSIPYNSLSIQNDTAFIVGNEVSGIKKEVLNQCDQIVEIPMRGEKESLNVSVATGIILFSLPAED